VTLVLFFLVTVLTGVARADTMVVQWKIISTGYGPGVSSSPLIDDIRTVISKPYCPQCDDLFINGAGSKACVTIANDPGLFQGFSPTFLATGIASAPPGQTNATITLGGDKDVIFTGDIGISGPGGGIYHFPCGGGCTIHLNLPSGDHFVAAVAQWIGGTNSLIACGCFSNGGSGCLSCNGGDACGFGGDATFSLNYLRFAADTPTSCVDSGKSSLAANGEWTLLGAAGCLQDPFTLTSRTFEIKQQGQGDLDVRLVADINQPDGPAGPFLIAKVNIKCSTCQDVAIPLKQGDCGNPCADTLLGDSATITIGNAGCLLTCVAMIKGTNPCSENNFGKSVNAYKKGDLKLYALAEWSGYKYEIIQPMPYDADIIAAVCKGDHIIAEAKALNGKRHFVLVTGQVFDSVLGKCRLSVNDPACNAPKPFLDELDVISYRRLFK